MKNYHTLIAVGLTPLALASVLVGCGSTQQENTDTSPTAESTTSVSIAPTASPSTGTRTVADGTCYDLSQVDRTSATDVAQAYSAVAYCWDSTLDGRTTDGMLRAKDIMSDEFYQTQAESQTRNMLQAQFNEAYKHEGYTSVKVSQTPGDTNQDIDSDKAVRGVSTQWEWTGRDGQNLPGGRAQDNVYLEKHNGVWEVVAVDNSLFEND